MQVVNKFFIQYFINRCLLVALLFFLIPTTLIAQKISDSIYRHSFSVTTENDAYLFHLRDGYYTNGLQLHWQKLSNRKKYPIIKNYVITQKIYTPQGRRFYRLNGIDRPFCGYLSLGYGEQHFKKPHLLWEWQAQLALIGPQSQGQWLQTNYHNWFGFPDFFGWENQLSNAAGLQLYVKRAQQITLSTNTYFIPEATILGGNLMATASFSPAFVIGKMRLLQNSAFAKARTGNSRSHTNNPTQEIFGFYQPSIIVQGINSTITGTQWLQTTTGVTKTIQPVYTSHKLGITYARRKWWYAFSLVFEGREVKEQGRKHHYGSITMGFNY